MDMHPCLYVHVYAFILRACVYLSVCVLREMTRSHLPDLLAKLLNLRTDIYCVSACVVVSTLLYHVL